MSGDTLVFDMASESEGSPAVFVRKDWLSILDNQNGSYQGNQSVIDTSQLANSNKYINYREAYFTVPMLLTLSAPLNATAANCPPFAALPCTQAVGLKNWYGSIIHSFTLDYNGTTIIQQTPYIGLWNSFKLMTGLSVNDVKMMGPQIGFFPDSSESVGKGALLSGGNAASGMKAGVLGTTVNNQMAEGVPNLMNNLSTNYLPSSMLIDNPTNHGLQQRVRAWNLDPFQQQGSVAVFELNNSGPAYVAQKGQFFQGGTTLSSATGQAVSGTVSGLTQLWKSYLFNRVSASTTQGGCVQWAITAQIYLKHIHSFFERVPLLKGVFCKMTLNLNQSSVTATTLGGVSTALSGQAGNWTSCSVQSPLGGVSPIMIASGEAVGVGTYGPLTTALATTGNNTALSSESIDPTQQQANVVRLGTSASLLMYPTTYTVSLAVGQRCLNTTQTGGTVSGIVTSPLGTSIILNAPAYTFSPVFEASFLSDPVKKIVYSDVYQYQVLNISAGGVFNNLITNGIANIKSVLVLPFFSAGTAGVPNSTVATGNGGLIPFQSPFDPAGGGPTSPYCLLNQFNIQISGQNAIYNTERYAYEQFMNQTYGVNAVNAGMTDGMSSGLVSQKDFETCYNYYYVNCGRMLPVEEAVPKSVNIIGQNQSAYGVDLYVFVEYGVEIDVDVLTGARV